jgi:hypothetical protein
MVRDKGYKISFQMGPAALTGGIDGVGVKQSSPGSEIKLGK